MANYTPITTGAAANASTINTPLGQLDAAIGDISGMGTVATTLGGAIAEHETQINSLNATVRADSTNTGAGQSAGGAGRRGAGG